MLYVGLDVHSRQSSLCILNSSGGLVNRCEVKGPRSAVVQRLRQLNEPFSLCYEAFFERVSGAAHARPQEKYTAAAVRSRGWLSRHRQRH